MSSEQFVAFQHKMASNPVPPPDKYIVDLRARSIDEPAARAMLTLAFAESVLERVRIPALRERFVERVAARLRAWEQLP